MNGRKLEAVAADVMMRAVAENLWPEARGWLAMRGVGDVETLRHIDQAVSIEAEAGAIRAMTAVWFRRALAEDANAVLKIRDFVDRFGAERGSRTHNTVSGSTVGTLVQSGTIGTFHYNAAAAPPDPALWMPAAETTAVALGGRHDRPYVERDADAELDALVRGGGLVLVTGEPLTGRTTTAWAALHRLADHQVCVPPPGTDLRTLPERIRDRGGRCVLWLDDLERHLGDGGLDATLLARLTTMGVLVLATMTDTAYDEHRFGTSAHARLLLSHARVVELSREWSDAEWRRLRQHDDPHLNAVRLFTSLSITEYLAVAPELWAEWQWARRPSGRPRGHLLVRAAIDLARCGLRRLLPLELLREAHEAYGEDLDGSFEDALEWAVRPRLGLTGLLTEGKRGWGAFASLTAEAERDGATPPVPYAVWELALAHNRGAVQPRLRKELRARADAGEAEAAYRLGCLDGDEALLRTAADAGHVGAAGELGRLLADRGETREAEAYLEAAAEAGDARAATLLGMLLRDRARRWLHRAVVNEDARDLEAAEHLADLHLGAGEIDEAHYWYLEVVHTGSPRAAGSYGLLHRIWQQEDIARVWFDRAFDGGDRRYRDAYGDIMTVSQAESQLRVEYEEAEPGTQGVHATHLGAFLDNQGRPDEARAHYEEGFRLGDPYGAFRLARLLEKEGRPQDAATWMRKAADAGHPGARKALEDGADTVEG